MVPDLMGFNHSRQNDALASTVGPTADPVARRYHQLEHFEIELGQPARTFASHFSLGLVQLEVGLWKALDAILERESAGSSAASNESVLRMLREKRMLLLGHYMGSDYQEAMMACLGGLGG